MLLLCNLWLRLREQFSIEKEQQECIQSCLMHLLRWPLRRFMLLYKPSFIPFFYLP
ncbi:hypothetical protein RchiOBHm_Chr5g0068851 [Rosa chinensis]|uniref:Uncharacterized protein n=1 Tax=Rosa chinensis TaxID=74649 RepID=A0A2P6QJQ9_ROSCH|nr:hypothetical protein RchiOBHm_Chr5g0068851 [Rosa chinensis]